MSITDTHKYDPGIFKTSLIIFVKSKTNKTIETNLRDGTTSNVYTRCSALFVLDFTKMISEVLQIRDHIYVFM